MLSRLLSVLLVVPAAVEGLCVKEDDTGSYTLLDNPTGLVLLPPVYEYYGFGYYASDPNPCTELSLSECEQYVTIVESGRSGTGGYPDEFLLCEVRDVPRFPDAVCGKGERLTSSVPKCLSPPPLSPQLLQPPPPPPSSFPAGGGSVKGRKDPHLYLAHGGRADFRGATNTTFCFLSAKNVSFNVKMEASDFKWKQRLVHGTRMSSAFWTLRTSPSGTLVRAAFTAEAGGRHIATVHVQGRDATTIRAGMPKLVVEDTAFDLQGKTLTVTCDKRWKMAATVSSFPFASLNSKKVLLDVEATPLYDVDHDVVAPHGLFGQSFDRDDVAVDGKRDAVDPDHDDVTTTTAQAEGAIEGSWQDYVLAEDFGTDFKYSRFSAAEAAPRNVSKLSGKKHARLDKSLTGGEAGKKASTRSVSIST